MKVGDIVKIKYLPGSRDIITNIQYFISLENSDYLFFEDELELHEDQIKLNNRNDKLNDLGI